MLIAVSGLTILSHAHHGNLIWNLAAGSPGMTHYSESWQTGTSLAQRSLSARSYNNSVLACEIMSFVSMSVEGVTLTKQHLILEPAGYN